MLQYLYLQANNIADMNKSVIEKFLQYLLIERRFPKNTVVAYRNDLTQLQEFYNSENVNVFNDWWKKLNPKKIEAYKIHLRNKEYLSSTINRKISSMRCFLNFLNDEDLIKVNPSEGTQLDKFITKRAPEYLTLEEIKQILNVCSGDNHIDIRDKAMVGLLYSSGLRVSELVSLKIINISDKKGWIRVEGKGSKQRFVPVYNQAWQDLECYLAKSRPILKNKFTDDSLFVNARGKMMTRQGFWDVLKKLTQKSGVNKSVSPHMLRHTFATHLLQGGANLMTVKELLGHSNINTTQIYTHLVNENVRDSFYKSVKGPGR